MQKRSNKFMFGAIIGGTLGALTTLFFDSNKGKKIQKRWMKRFHDMDAKTGHFGINKFANRYKKMTRRSRKNKSRRTR